MMMPTARSMTLPLAMNSWNSLITMPSMRARLAVSGGRERARTVSDSAIGESGKIRRVQRTNGQAGSAMLA
jgi:hypothetical protein